MPPSPWEFEASMEPGWRWFVLYPLTPSRETVSIESLYFGLLLCFQDQEASPRQGAWGSVLAPWPQPTLSGHQEPYTWNSTQRHQSSWNKRKVFFTHFIYVFNSSWIPTCYSTSAKLIGRDHPCPYRLLTIASGNWLRGYLCQAPELCQNGGGGDHSTMADQKASFLVKRVWSGTDSWKQRQPLDDSFAELPAISHSRGI